MKARYFRLPGGRRLCRSRALELRNVASYNCIDAAVRIQPAAICRWE